MVHNYGHGANGIYLSWGTAVEAAQLVCEVLNNVTSVTNIRNNVSGIKARL